ncbi:MAG: translation elongation factor 4 [Patescibacteria group bacterium]
MEEKNIRNFCIIAHIDHGKSTLADRMLEITSTVEKREMKEQLLDQMDIERERGITIKLAPVRMEYSKHILNLIDTPGHVDFSYEVSRSLAAVEGAILLVDATQGIEAQTLSTLYAAIDHDLEIIPVVNKIDLPAARPEEVAHEIIKVLGCRENEIIYASGKTGEGVEEILKEVIERVPAPNDEGEEKTRALIFDSVYDPYRGVVAYVRVFSGEIKNNDEIFLMQTKSGGKVEECGYFKPKYFPHSPLSSGEIGYIVTGFKEVSEASVGDTITQKKIPAVSPLSGYQKVKPFVYASIFCTDSDKYPELKEAIGKLKLNDGSLSYEAERSEMLGHGFRCGFLGLLHLDIVRERLEREFDLDLVITSPTVIYKLTMLNGEARIVEKAADLPASHEYREIFEPWATLEIITPKEFIGVIMDLTQSKRGIYKNTEYFDDNRVVIKYEIPLAELIIDYYDQLKSISRGYASLNYEMIDYRSADLSKIDILIAEDRVDALSFIINSQKAQKEARRIVERLKDLIPRQNFEVKIQVAISATIIASERIPAMRKDVTAKLYGGDVTRKNKLLDKQKKGKKKMKMIGKVNIPSDVFIKVLRSE